jgi:hypothetical protein
VKIKELTDIPAIRDYLRRIGAEPRSLKTAVVRQVAGKYWRDLASIKFSKTGDVDCIHAEYAPTDLERQMIAAGCAEADWPELKPLHRIINAPPMIADARDEDLFEFRDITGQITMVQVRRENDKGKAYVPWTYWDDDEWRACEPDGPLPLYGLERLADNSTVFIHEGAKAAARMQRLVDAADPETAAALAEHPWGPELMGAAHLGWIGGALSPQRTDWAVLKRMGIKRAYIVADNDEPGRAAVPAISQQLRLPTFAILFTDEFPVSFDLADPFPERMFAKDSGDRVYVGPSFRDCLHPATWATDVVPSGTKGGRPTHVLRDSFASMWAYIEEADTFVCTQMPEIIRSEAVLNKMLAAFSHVAETSRLIVKAYQGRTTSLCYRPDHKGLKVTFRGSSSINLHIPCGIRPKSGDPQPFLDFMEYLIPNERERYQALRWCATLIARPDLRMGYGMLLISETQGVGKTTLGASILAPLVGYHNVSYPGENDITSSFNEWVARKRLAIVNEIYSGSSWKAYNALKSVITDRDVTVNQKYQRQYTIENWCHVLAASNSKRALKMENDDRRWFYPEVTEEPWPGEKFEQLRRWLQSGGLPIIRNWAEGFGDYVRPSDRAPMTRSKRDMIEGSRSEAQELAASIAGLMKDAERPMAVLMKDVVGWVDRSARGKVFDNDYELRRAMKDAGARTWPKRMKVMGMPQYVIVNDALWRLAQNKLVSDGDRHEQRDGQLAALAVIREHFTKVSDFMQEQM